MKLKNLILAGLGGTIVDFLLGWLIYGILLKDFFPSTGNENLTFIFLGCLTFSFFVAYVFIKWAHITNFKTGIKAGAIMGFFTGLYMNFFMQSVNPCDAKLIVVDVLASIILGAAVGLTVATINRKM